MPIYEYRCLQCGRRVSFFWRTYAEAKSEDLRCPHCGSRDLVRLASRVRMVRSEESRLDDLSDPSQFGDVDENDPRSVGRWMRRMSSEMGEDMGPEFGEVVDRLEAGQAPEDIEGEMPDLGSDLAGSVPD